MFYRKKNDCIIYIYLIQNDWQRKDEYAEDPEQISPRVNAAFVYKKTQSKAEEIQQLRSEVTRLQRELRLRSEEVYRLRGIDIKDTSQHQGTSKPKNV